MVLSTTKRTASISSITRQSTNGGPMKAGLPYSIGRTSEASVFLRNMNQTADFWALPVTTTTVRNLPMNFSHSGIRMR